MNPAWRSAPDFAMRLTTSRSRCRRESGISKKYLLSCAYTLNRPLFSLALAVITSLNGLGPVFGGAGFFALVVSATVVRGAPFFPFLKRKPPRCIRELEQEARRQRMTRPDRVFTDK